MNFRYGDKVRFKKGDESVVYTIVETTDARRKLVTYRGACGCLRETHLDSAYLELVEPVTETVLEVKV